MMTLDERQAKARAWSEARRTELQAALAELDAKLREINLTAFRDAMRGLFARHPILESVRFDQAVAYNDEFDIIDINELWVNDQHFYDDRGILEGYTARDLIPSFEDDFGAFPTISFGPLHGPADPFYKTLSWPSRSASIDERSAFKAQAAAALREHFGPLYDAALDTSSTLRGLRKRYGLHFFWDAFGHRAAVEVRRDTIHITEDVSTEQPSDPRYLGLTWQRRYLGPLAAEYVTSPERAGLVGLREAYRDELRQLEHSLIRGHLYEAIGRNRPHRSFGYTREGRRITHLHVLGHDIPVWDSEGYLSAPWLRPLVGVEKQHGPDWPPPAERYYGALRAALGSDIEAQTRIWADALVRVREEYGHDAFNTLPPWELARTVLF